MSLNPLQGYHLVNASPWPLLVSNFMQLSLLFTFLVTCLSTLCTINQLAILKSNMLQNLLEHILIQRFAAFCVICSRIFFSKKKKFLAFCLAVDVGIVLGFLFVRLYAIRIAIVPNLPMGLTLILSLLAMFTLICRTVLRFGAFVDINKAIDFTGGPSSETFIFIAKKFFKITINNIPPINSNTPKYISYMNKATLGVAIIGTGITSAIYYESRQVRLATERSVDIAQRNADIAQRSADIAAFSQGLIDKETYLNRNPEDRPQGPKV